MVKTLIIGCGAAFEQLYRGPLRSLEKRGWIRICGAVDPLEERCRLASTWFRHAETFGNLDEALSSLSDIDLAIICSPPAYHATHAMAAFNYGCHVLCEKPLAHSITPADEMVAAARAHNRILAVGMVRRLYPSIQIARQMITTEQLGVPLHFVYREGGTFGWPVASPALFHRETSGGGVLLDKGIHALDLLSYLLGAGEITKSADDALDPRCVEANASATLKFGSATGTVALSWDMPMNNGLHLMGPKAELWLPLLPIQTIWERRPATNGSWRRLTHATGWPANLAKDHPPLREPQSLIDCFELQLIAALRAVTLGTPPIASGKEARDVLQLAVAAYENASPLAKPWLPPAEQRDLEQSHWRHAAPQSL